MEVLHLDQASFEKVTSQTAQPVLIDFWAEWCGPCQMMGPVLEELAAEHPDLIVGKVNVDDQRQLAIQMEIDSIPALFFYRNGKLEKRLIGFRKKPDLIAALGL